MKPRIVFALAIALSACSPSEEQRTREQARQTAEQAGKDAKQAARDIKVGAERAGKELDKDLHQARQKVRDALNQPDDKGNK